MTVEDFATASEPAEKGDAFQLQNRTLLAIDLAGSMVAYSGDVYRSPSDLVGQSSDETSPLEFSGGEGFVVVQPFEEGALT